MAMSEGQVSQIGASEVVSSNDRACKTVATKVQNLELFELSECLNRESSVNVEPVVR